MPNIALYQFQPKSSEPSNVRVDSGLLDRQYNAGARVGQDIAGLADPITAAMVAQNRAQDYKQLTTVDTAMAEEWDKFQNNLNPSTDESKWVGDWQKQLDTRLAKETPKDTDPHLKQEMQIRTEQFRVRTSGDVGHQAKVNGVEKAKVAGLTRNAQLWQAGDAAGAEANLHEMAKVGLIFPEEIPGLMKKGQTVAEHNDAVRLINTDPINAQTILEDRTEGGKPRHFPNLDEADRYSLTTQAERNSSQLRTQSYQALTARMNDGEILTKAELDGWVEKKHLTSTQAKDILRQQKAGKLDTAGFAELSAKILNYDRTADPTRTSYADLFAATLGYPDAARSALLSDLNKKDDPSSKLNTPASHELFRRAAADYNDGLFLPWDTVTKKEGGFFGFGGTPKTETVQPGETDLKAWKDGTLKKEVRDTANAHYATYLSKMRDFFTQKPNATDAEAEAYSQELKKPYVMAKAAAALAAPQPASTVPKPISTEAEYNALPKGATFTWKGRTGIKP